MNNLYKVWTKGGLILIRNSNGCIYTLVEEDKTSAAEVGDHLTVGSEDNPEELDGRWLLAASFSISEEV